MGKDVKHDFSKETSNQPENIVNTNKVVEMKNIQQDTSKELTDNNIDDMRNMTKRELLKRFGMICDIKEHQQPSKDFLIFNITKKDIKQRGEGQIRIAVSKDAKFNIHLNPYDDYYGEYYFAAEGTQGLDAEEFAAEFDNFMSFIDKGEFAEHGKFKKIVNYDPNESDDELLAGRGINPEKYKIKKI